MLWQYLNYYNCIKVSSVSFVTVMSRIYTIKRKAIFVSTDKQSQIFKQEKENIFAW